nr:premnaspirodiene oxygenase-like [Ipomoea batatas]
MWKLPFSRKPSTFGSGLPFPQSFSSEIYQENMGPIMHLQAGRNLHSPYTSPQLARSHKLKPRPLVLRQQAKLNGAGISCSSKSTDVVFSPYEINWRQMRKICVLELLSRKMVIFSPPSPCSFDRKEAFPNLRIVDKGCRKLQGFQSTERKKEHVLCLGLKRSATTIIWAMSEMIKKDSVKAKAQAETKKGFSPPFINAWAMATNTENWEESKKDFLPERFENSSLWTSMGNSLRGSSVLVAGEQECVLEIFICFSTNIGRIFLWLRLLLPLHWKLS